MQHRFFALISRMRYIGRWGLMRNTFEENIQEHSHMVAVLAHGLAMIQRDILGEPADPDRCAVAALFHDASEILTGDLPTPIKYYNPEIKSAYKQIEAVSCEKLLALLPPELQARIFNGYFCPPEQGDKRRNMGIGLSVCKSIVQAHGGAMRASNRPTGGALLQFTLPLEETSHEDQRKSTPD